MAAVNQQPIYTKRGEVSANAGVVTTAAMGKTLNLATGDYTGISANHQIVFTADATNGGFIQRLRFKAAGTLVATVARIYINNGGVNTVAANNSYYGDQSLPAVTQSLTAATMDVDYPLNLALNPGFTILVGLATQANVAGTATMGWVVSPVGGAY